MLRRYQSDHIGGRRSRFLPSAVPAVLLFLHGSPLRGWSTAQSFALSTFMVKHGGPRNHPTASQEGGGRRSSTDTKPVIRPRKAAYKFTVLQLRQGPRFDLHSRHMAKFGCAPKIPGFSSSRRGSWPPRRHASILLDYARGIRWHAHTSSRGPDTGNRKAYF